MKKLLFLNLSVFLLLTQAVNATTYDEGDTTNNWENVCSWSSCGGSISSRNGYIRIKTSKESSRYILRHNGGNWYNDSEFTTSYDVKTSSKRYELLYLLDTDSHGEVYVVYTNSLPSTLHGHRWDPNDGIWKDENGRDAGWGRYSYIVLPSTANYRWQTVKQDMTEGLRNVPLLKNDSILNVKYLQVNNWDQDHSLYLDNIKLLDSDSGSTPPPSGGTTGTIDVKISQSSDDADQDNHSRMDLNGRGSSHFISMTSSRPYIGFRFQDINIPQGATITSAVIKFVPMWPDNGSSLPSLYVYGQNSDTASTFSSNNNNISSRPRTSSRVLWQTQSNWKEDGRYFDTPSVRSVVQEIVNRSGWSNGNDLAFIIKFNSGSKWRAIRSYDTNANQAPRLVVTYKVDGNSGGGNGGGTGGGTDPETKKELWFTFKDTTKTVDAAGKKVNSISLNANSSSLVYTDGTTASGIVLETSNSFEGLNSNNYNGTSGNIVPVEMLTKYSWWVGELDINSDGTKDMSGAVTVKGLNPGDKYTIKLGAIRTLDGNSATQQPSRESTYVINGVTKIFNADDANNREATITTVATSEGEITVSVSTTNHTADMDFAYLGWMKLIPGGSVEESDVINANKLVSIKALMSSAVNGDSDVTYITAGDSKRENDRVNYPTIYRNILSKLNVTFKLDSRSGITAEEWANKADDTVAGIAKTVKDATGYKGSKTIIEYSLGANDWNNLPRGSQGIYGKIYVHIKKGITEIQRRLPNAKILLVNPIGTYRTELKKVYRDLAKELNLPMLENPMDKYRDNADTMNEYFLDSIHPNTKGANVLVKHIMHTATEGTARVIVDSN